MKLIILLATVLFLNSRINASGILRKRLHRSKRCICLTITPLCKCYSDQPPQHLYEEAQVVVPRTSTALAAAPTFPPQIRVNPFGSEQCFPNCLHDCMQNQYSQCKQSCLNTCRAEREPVQYPLQPLSYPQEVRYDLMPNVKQYPQPLLAPRQVQQIQESSSGPALPSSTICIKACMPDCRSPCIQRNTPEPLLPYSAVTPTVIPYLTSTRLPIFQQTLQNEPLVQRPYREQATCIAICMPSCQSQCIRQANLLPVTPIPTPAPLLPPAPIRTPEPLRPTQTPSCVFQCRSACNEQCTEQEKALVQCDPGCISNCEYRCARDGTEYSPNFPSGEPSFRVPQPLPKYQQPYTAVPNQPTFQNPTYHYKDCLQQQSAAIAELCICPSGYERCNIDSNNPGCCKRK